jgi:pre-mRNA branch site protein p14
VRLPPEVNRILYVRCVRSALLHACCRALTRSGCRSNLPFNISAEEMYDIFGKYGAVRQIRLCVPASWRLCVSRSRAFVCCLPAARQEAC